MANVKNNAASKETQRRLFQAAGELFAERGFHSTTLKEITERAGASVASVNYHFRDKAELYALLLHRIAGEIAMTLPDDEPTAGDPVQRLGQYLRQLFMAAMERDRPGWERLLITREFVQPSPALQPMIDRVVQPIGETISRLVAEAISRAPDSAEVGMLTASITAQLCYYMTYPLDRLHPQLSPLPDIDALADHIAGFSMAGVRAAAEKFRRPARHAAPRRQKTQSAGSR
jgi:AcrR family transcriptional regulator